MPRRINIKDGQVIYYAYRIGFVDGIEKFDEVKSCIAYVSDSDGNFSYGNAGSEYNFSVDIIINLNSDTYFIDKYTKIWVTTVPIDSSDKPDYIINTEPLHRDGQILISCTSSTLDNIQLYYQYGEDVISFEAIDDLENNKFIIKSNTFLPIDTNTKLWYLKPVDINDTNNTMSVQEIKRSKKITEYMVTING